MNFPVSLRNPTDPVRGHPLQRRQFVGVVGDDAVAALTVASVAGLTGCARPVRSRCTAIRKGCYRRPIHCRARLC